MKFIMFMLSFLSLICKILCRRLKSVDISSVGALSILSINEFIDDSQSHFSVIIILLYPSMLSVDIFFTNLQYFIMTFKVTFNIS